MSDILCFSYGISAREQLAMTHGVDVSSARFTTFDVQPADRLPTLQQFFQDKVGLEIDTSPGHAVDMRLHRSHGLRRAQMMSSLTARMARLREKIADGDDTVCMMVNTGGRIAVEQKGRQSLSHQGEAVCLVYREPARLHFADATYLSIRVPLTALSGLSSLDFAPAAHVPGGSEALQLLVAYVGSLPLAFTDARVAKAAAEHVYDLVALALGATAEARDAARLGALRAGRLAAVKAELAHDPMLSIEQVAGRRGISSRYVQLLFEQSGTTFSRHALDLRLSAARRLLASPRHTAWSIAAIAMDSGFGDLSYFNRSFKTRFGMTPSEARQRPPEGIDEAWPQEPHSAGD